MVEGGGGDESGWVNCYKMYHCLIYPDKKIIVPVEVPKNTCLWEVMLYHKLEF